jgi:hypothetical protein
MIQRTLLTAAAALCISALSLSPSFAQGAAAPSAGGGAQGSEAGPQLGPSAGPNSSPDRNFTVDSVTPDRPYGNIVVGSNVTERNMSTFRSGLSAAERAELSGRCSVILQNRGRYHTDTVTFCSNYSAP